MDSDSNNLGTGRLPAPRRLLADLIRAIAAIPLESEVSSTTGGRPRSNALRRVPAEHRALLATLHVLFPSLLLPALDLLDRRRVVRFQLSSPTGQKQQKTQTPAAAAIYQIRGDQAHVVHLGSWHCTCAFFALAVANQSQTDANEDTENDNPSRAFSTPPCKHLLACVLAEEWPALREYVCPAGSSDAPATPELLAGLVAGVL